ncbi:DNA repair protein RecO [Anaeromyxobacter paludicola]|uniref:DNA repair protein RecO n=1 Tax=Anaeromyxobacter paludicola TaxID=2918171 RepID=A0ABM7X876_9BACT|nr:DNA repair protein RecO [Anaeromyxobacter paludicola]BDG08047.1 DNA repair protein RecO [Anaeromyxobacter paludicola]
MTRLELLAVVLRTTDYGESDRVVSLFTEERGKLSAFARGARASRKRFGGALEPFTVLVASLKERPSGDLYGLETVSVRAAFGGIRGDLTRIACAGYACDLARELTRDAEPHPELFQLLCDYLALLDRAPARPAALRAFELGALREAGFAPRLDACARCGAPVTAGDAPRHAFDLSHGGALCPPCAGSGAGGTPVSAEALDALLRLSRAGLEEAALAPLTPAAGAEAQRLLARFVEHLVGHRLASRKFLDELGPMLG